MTNFEEFLKQNDAVLIDTTKLSNYETWAMNFFTKSATVGDPYVDITMQLDVTEAYQNYLRNYKMDGSSFFIFLLWKITRCINKITQLNYRFLNDKWYYLPKPPIFMPVAADDNMRFINIILTKITSMNWQNFVTYFRQELTRQKHAPVMQMGAQHYYQTSIFVSNLSEITFTAYKRNTFNAKGATQAIVLGKRYQQNDLYYQPFYINSHHANADGHILNILISNITKSICENQD